jgi:hypothetical protein
MFYNSYFCLLYCILPHIAQTCEEEKKIAPSSFTRHKGEDAKAEEV